MRSAPIVLLPYLRIDLSVLFVSEVREASFVSSETSLGYLFCKMYSNCGSCVQDILMEVAV